jgi:hypothetical protein
VTHSATVSARAAMEAQADSRDGALAESSCHVVVPSGDPKRIYVVRAHSQQ